MSVNPAGWYPDPFGRAEVRWWSGSGWTEHVGTGGQSFMDAPGDASHASVPHAAVPMVVPSAQAPPLVPVVTASSTKSASTRVAIVGVVALLAGAAGGWLLRGDSSGKGGTGAGNSSGSLTTPILQGLASLDQYEYSLHAVTVGPTDQDRSEMTGSGAVDAATDGSHQQMTTTDATADDPEPSTGTTESWSSKDSTCSFDGELYTMEARNPFEADLGPVLSGLFDIVVPSGNAKLVGSEQIAGIDADHYTFTIEGLGAGTGAQVDKNSGEVWVASDGGYLLKYVVSASMRSGPAGAADSESYVIDVTLELTSVNQSVDVAMPSGCA